MIQENYPNWHKPARRRALNRLRLVQKTAPQEPEPVKPPMIAKGVCGKCGKHIGRGILAHEKACK